MKKNKRGKVQRDIAKILRPETKQAKQWAKLGSIDLSKAFKHEA